MITIPQLSEVQDIGDTDVVMITHSDGTSKKIAGQNILSAGTNTVMATSTSITGPALKTGMGIKVFFTVALTGSNTTTPLTLTYNGVSKTVKVPKDGALADFCAFEVSTGVYKYCQAYTTLELIYDGTNFVIIGNPVVLSSSTYLYYADGSHVADSVASGNKKAVTSHAVADRIKNIWNITVQANTATLIHKDVDTASKGFFFLRICIWGNTSTGDNTHCAEVLLRMNFTPYNGQNYRDVTPVVIKGIYRQNDITNTYLQTFGISFSWDSSGVKIQSSYRVYVEVDSKYGYEYKP